MIVREFSEQDIDEITSLMKNLCTIKGQSFDELRWRKNLEKQLKSDKSSTFFVAFDRYNDQVIGMGQCSIRTANDGFQFGYISNLIVKEEKRRTGAGEKLMREMIDFFKRNHINSVRLALKTNKDLAARVLFTKLGFEDVFHILELKI